jgi:hypothetical protein
MTLVVSDIRRPIRTERGEALETSLIDQYEEYGEEPRFLKKVIGQHSDQLIDHAIYLKDVWGVNHRRFWVGACAVATVAGRISLFESANHSPHFLDAPGESITRNCAEMGVFGRAYQVAMEEGLELGDVALQHLFIAGPSNPRVIRTSSGLIANTLAPCYDCSPILIDSPHSVPELPVTMIAPGSMLVVEHSTASEIVAAYAEVSPPLSSYAATAGNVLCRQAFETA